MTPELGGGPISVVDFDRVKISEKIKDLIRRRPPAEEELAARAEAEAVHERARLEAAEGDASRAAHHL